MIEATASSMAERFNEFLAKVERGEIVRISSRGRTVARLAPDCDFMPGREAAALFQSHRGDAEAADAIARELREIELNSEDALDH